MRAECRKEMLKDAGRASQAINKHLCEPNAARMLTHAGRASQQARNVDGQKPWLVYKTFEDKRKKTQPAEEFGPVKSTSIAKVSNTPKTPCADRRYPQKEGPGRLSKDNGTELLRSEPPTGEKQFSSPGSRKAFCHDADDRGRGRRGPPGTIGCTDGGLG
ncbi:MAG: hypothetical protein L6R38_003288 [Xanthoria sp. 2 TBL-2021]|nr:MAG: hypothetical protein L6R38_003288 [Xanthoria sp. 2 TBL-2021]